MSMGPIPVTPLGEPAVAATTRIRHCHFTPRLLGWSRWEIVLEYVSGPVTYSEVLASGSRWRNRADRHYREYVYEVAGVGELNCDDQWIADQLVKSSDARRAAFPC